MKVITKFQEDRIIELQKEALVEGYKKGLDTGRRSLLPALETIKGMFVQMDKRGGVEYVERLIKEIQGEK